MHDLRSALASYREVTEKLCLCIKSDNLDSIGSLLDKRDKIIEYISSLSYSQKEFAEICNGFELLQHEEQLNIAMNSKRTEYKIEIDRISAGKNAAVSYTQKSYVDSMFFNKKI